MIDRSIACLALPFSIPCLALPVTLCGSGETTSRITAISRFAPSLVSTFLLLLVARSHRTRTHTLQAGVTRAIERPLSARGVLGRHRHVLCAINVRCTVRCTVCVCVYVLQHSGVPFNNNKSSPYRPSATSLQSSELPRGDSQHFSGHLSVSLTPVLHNPPTANAPTKRL